jgi:hypothetical protein
MGRSYLFECSRCGYRARVSGKTDRGVNFWVQTILCQDCKGLHDAVIRLRVPHESPLDSWRNTSGFFLNALNTPQRKHSSPPVFTTLLNQLSPRGARRYQWVRFNPQCPVSWIHRVQAWETSHPCPKCGLQMERTVLPYRLWD